MTIRRRKPVALPRALSGAKIRGTVRTASAILVDVVVQASLDPNVTGIEHLAKSQFRGKIVPLDFVVIDRGGHRRAIELAEERPLRSVDAEGLVLLALRDLDIEIEQITAGDVAQEPKHTNCRLVWACQAHRVPAGLRMQIQQLLSDDGPLRLGELLGRIHSDGDPMPAVLSLACADLLELDLTDIPLGPDTMVRTRIRNTNRFVPQAATSQKS